MKKGFVMAALLALAAQAGLMGTARAATPAETICSSSNTIFCTGFEEGNFSLWDDYDGNPGPYNALIADPGPLNLSGNTVTRLRVPPGRGTTDLTKILSSSYDKMYVRWYQKWESDFDFQADQHGGGIHAGDRSLLGHSDYRPTGSDWFSSWLEPFRGRLVLYTYYRGMYQDCADPNGTCWGDRFPCWMDEGTGYCTKAAHRERVMPPLMQTSKWYCLEMMVDAGTAVSQDSQANGSLDYWIDDTEYGPWNNLWFRTTANLKVNILWMDLFHHGDHSVGGTMIDNIVVSKTRIGCAGSTPPPAKKPNPPTGVGAQ